MLAVAALTLAAAMFGSEPDAGDHDGHGTGAATAAGGGQSASPYGWLSGVAPKAHIGNYKVLGPEGGSSDVIAKAIDDAVADGMDVINLSLGAYVVSYSDIDASEIGQAAIARADKAGVVVVVAAGNEGPGATTIADYASAPDAIALGAIHNDRTLAYGITADGATFQAFTGGGTDPGQVVSGMLIDAALACSALPDRAAAGRIALIERGTCSFEVKLTNAAAAGAMAALIYNNPGGSTFSSNSVTVGAATLPALFVNQAEGEALKGRTEAALDFTGATPFGARTDVSEASLTVNIAVGSVTETVVIPVY